VLRNLAGHRNFKAHLFPFCSARRSGIGFVEHRFCSAQSNRAVSIAVHFDFLAPSRQYHPIA